MQFFDTTAPWAIQPEQLARIEALAHERMKAGAAGIEAAAPGASRPSQPGVRLADGVAIIDVVGPLTKNYSWMTAALGGTSMLHAAALIQQAAADPAVRGILLHVDSPGGSVDGTEAFADAIRAATKAKGVLALASGTIASAAYWAASAADGVFLESKTTAAGSIGIVAKHQDISGLESRIGVKTTEISSGKYKRIASMHEPLSDAGRNSIQTQLDQIYGLFVQAVSSHRGVSVPSVLDRMADGRMFIGQNAIDAGLADGFASQAELVQRLSAGQAKQKNFNQPRKTVMTPQQINQEAFNQVGAGGTAAQYQAAINGLHASNQQEGVRCPRTGLTVDEKLEQADAYAKKNGVDLVSALKTLGFAK